MPDDATRKFLDRVQRDASISDREMAMEGARAVFYALMECGEGAAEPGDVAALLPEDIETLWKPAYYCCLRERSLLDVLEDVAGAGVADGPGEGGRRGDEEERFRRCVLDRLPELDEEEVRRLSRAVYAGMQPLLSSRRRSEIEALAPVALLSS